MKKHINYFTILFVFSFFYITAQDIHLMDQDKFITGILNQSRVRIRKEPNLGGEQIGSLNKDQQVYILDKTSEIMKIGNMESVWYKIKTFDGVEGWAYGYFIDLNGAITDIFSEDKNINVMTSNKTKTIDKIEEESNSNSDPIEEYWNILENLFKKPVSVILSEWGKPIEIKEEAPFSMSETETTYQFITLLYSFMTVTEIVGKDNEAQRDVCFLHNLVIFDFDRFNVFGITNSSSAQELEDIFGSAPVYNESERMRMWYVDEVCEISFYFDRFDVVDKMDLKIYWV
jgi:hypothetical protein